MIYDPTKPLIHCHVIRTGGTSLRDNLRGMGFTVHGAQQSSYAPRSAVSTHFRSFDDGYNEGLRFDQLPEGHEQRITFLRHPFTWLVSVYHFVRRKHGMETDLLDFIKEPRPRMKSYLPLDSWKRRLDDFLFVGTVDRYPACLRALAAITEATEATPEWRNGGPVIRYSLGLAHYHREVDPEIYELYDHVVERWSPIWDQYA